MRLYLPSHCKHITITQILLAAALLALAFHFGTMHLTTAMNVSKKDMVIAGLPIHVYSARAWTEKSGPVAVMFILHGRTGTAKGIEWIAEDTLKHVASEKKKGSSAMDLIIVTFVSAPPAESCSRA